MARITDAQWLAEQFTTEMCSECGWDADKHQVGTDRLGNRRLVCTDPIPESLSDQAAQDEMGRRLKVKFGAAALAQHGRRRGGNVYQSITGTVTGKAVQAGDIDNLTL